MGRGTTSSPGTKCANDVRGNHHVTRRERKTAHSGREGDTEGATVLLNHAAELMPGDEEIAEELMILFNRLGRPTEEFRIRQRWSRESETKEAA